MLFNNYYLNLSVIIVNYNVKYFLEQCLCSVQKAIAEINAEIIVIDNNSSDGSIDYLQQHFPSVIFLSNQKNEGFSKANNKALQIAKGEMILFLNPDTIVAEDSFTTCVSFLQNTPNAGAAGIRMIDGSGKFLPESKRSFPSLLSSFYKLIGLAALFSSSKIFNHYALGNLDKNKNCEVPVLAGAFMMVKKEVLEKTHGFDESFFMYGEDIDLSFRTQQAGYKNYYIGQHAVIHFKGESSRKGSSNYVRMFYNAMNVFVKKHYKPANAKLFALFIDMAIVFSALASKLTQLFRLNNKKDEPAKQTFIIGSKQEYQQVLCLLQQANLHQTIVGRIAVEDDKEDCIGTLSNINQTIKQSALCELIFCEGQLSYSQIITAIQNINHCNFLFYSNKSNTIVGSHSKTRTGKAIVPISFT